MARTSTDLNFPKETEQAFLFYKEVFKTEFTNGGFRRFNDAPTMEGMPPLSDADLNLIMQWSFQ
ncbi:MAG: PhnB protein [Sphingobacteriales bacterium]|jgi:PhnB protein